MQKLFIIGNGPLPIEKGIVCQTAFGLRTWQFLSIAKDFPGEVFVVVISNPDHYKDKVLFNVPEVLRVSGKELKMVRLKQHSASTMKHLKSHWKEFNPSVCLGVNLPSAVLLSELNPAVPFWADLNGWAMAEAQSQAYIEQSNAYLPIIWQKQRQVLMTADRFSTVSQPQMYATYGELAAVGRMNSKTDGVELVSVIPNGNELDKLAYDTQQSRVLQEDEKQAVSQNMPIMFDLRRKLGLSTGAFIVFFSGAYNSWLDEKMLFEGLANAMQQNRYITFVSTGGVSGVTSRTFESFRARIQQSQFQDRFCFLGWITKEELLTCYAQVNLAINIDRDNAETLFGARNRINEWLAYGVPVMSTVGTEVTHVLARAGAIIPVAMGDASDLTLKILQATDTNLRAMALQAKEFAQQEFAYERTLRSLRTWLQILRDSPKAKEAILEQRTGTTVMSPSRWAQLRFRVKKDGWGVIFKYLFSRTVG